MPFPPPHPPTSGNLQVCLVLNKGKPSREHTYPAIRAALVSLLRAWGSPFTLADVPQGCRIQATACDITGAHCFAQPPCRAAVASLRRRSPAASPTAPHCPTCLPSPRADWLHTPEADRALAAFNARADGSRPLAKESFFQEDVGAEVRRRWWLCAHEVMCRRRAGSALACSACCTALST